MFDLTNNTNTANEKNLYFIFCRDDVLLHEGKCLFDDLPVGISVLHQTAAGIFQDKPLFAVEIEETTREHVCELILTKKVMGDCTPQMLAALSRAKQLLYWDRNHQFCGCCAERMSFAPDEIAKICERCDKRFYPNFAPAVIVLITRNEKVLLARSPHFPKGIYSTLAGFVEAGETAEQTIVREVKEEVGIEVENIRYFGSQAWPFPHSLMLAFTADYKSGEIQIDDDEIEAADWFNVDELPPLPSPVGISRAMIDFYINDQLIPKYPSA